CVQNALVTFRGGLSRTCTSFAPGATGICWIRLPFLVQYAVVKFPALSKSRSTSFAMFGDLSFGPTGSPLTVHRSAALPRGFQNAWKSFALGGGVTGRPTGFPLIVHWRRPVAFVVFGAALAEPSVTAAAAASARTNRRGVILRHIVTPFGRFACRVA